MSCVYVIAVLVVLLLVATAVLARRRCWRYDSDWTDWDRVPFLREMARQVVGGRREHLAAPARLCTPCAPCKNGTCSPTDGSCVCAPGWGGADCSKPINCCSGDPSTTCAEGSTCDPKTCKCSHLGPGCTKWAADGSCTACGDTYWYSGGVCVSCAQNCVNYPTGVGSSIHICNPTDGTCAPVDPNCAAPNADGSCNTCAPNYYPAPWTAA